MDMNTEMAALRAKLEAEQEALNNQVAAIEPGKFPSIVQEVTDALTAHKKKRRKQGYVVDGGGYKMLSLAATGGNTTPTVAFRLTDYGTSPETSVSGQLTSNGVVLKKLRTQEASLLAPLESAMRVVEDNPWALLNWANSSRCGSCGKALTDELSQSRGVGPECYTSWKEATERLIAAGILNPDGSERN